MSRLNTGKRTLQAPLQTEPAPSGKTHEGAPGFARDAKSELFMKATTQFAGEKTFYDEAAVADERSVELIRAIAAEDWAWVAGFLPWLRQKANIRTMSLMLAAQAADAFASRRLSETARDAVFTDGILTPRQVVAAVQQRGDEPGEILQYCKKTFRYSQGRNKGKPRIPEGVKHGTADAASRLYTERAAIRWDKPGRPMRFADVIEITHPHPFLTSRGEGTSRQSILFSYLLTSRHNGQGLEPPAELAGIHGRRILSQMSPQERHRLAAEALDNREGPAASRIERAAAGQWEWVRSWLGEMPEGGAGLSPRQQWELVIPWMGYMALLRNLRNFDNVGIRESLANKICQRLSDPEEVRNSRQLPFRFLTAYLNVPSVRWAQALERALHLSVPNVPALDGHTCILIDTSGSMEIELAEAPRKKGQKQPEVPVKRPTRVQVAALFALALALRNPGKVDVYGFANGNFAVENIQHGASLLRTTELFCQQVGKVGHGTCIAQNIRATFQKGRHTRVCAFTDEQAMPGGSGYNGWLRATMHGDVGTSVPAGIPLYSWNLAGYTHGCMATGRNRYALAGLTDHSFGIMSMLEAGRDGAWPWETDMRPVGSDDEEED